MIPQENLEKAIADFKELAEKVKDMPYGLIHDVYVLKIVHDKIAMTTEEGMRTEGFDLNYKSIAATIISQYGFADLQTSGVEVYADNGYLLGVVNMERYLKDDDEC